MLADALNRLRTVAYGGIFKEILKNLPNEKKEDNNISPICGEEIKTINSPPENKVVSLF